MFNKKELQSLSERIYAEADYRRKDAIDNYRNIEKVDRRLQVLLDYLGLKWEHIEEKDIIVKKEEKRG